MRPRPELALGALLLVLLGMGAALLGSRQARTIDTDTRRSTYLAGPGGARGFAESLERLGVTVVRHRRGIEWIDSLAGQDAPAIVLQPSRSLSAEEGRRIAELRRDLLLAGPATHWAMACLGYRVSPTGRAKVSAAGPDTFPSVRSTLEPRFDRTVTDSSRGQDAGDVTCQVPEPSGVDTLLRTTAGQPVAIALRYPTGRRVTLVSGDELFSNRALRQTAAGPFVLGLIVPRYRRVLVDELHHGYEVSGSLAGATLDWSLRSPWGWAVWQLVTVGVLALLAAGVRFGPARSVIVRRRRSPLEHVRALATALAAARGHRIAARLMVQGLRRRLSRSGRPDRGDLDAWLEGLGPSLRTPRGQAALAELTTLTRRDGDTDDVLRAAHAVETLWEELKPT